MPFYHKRNRIPALLLVFCICAVMLTGCGELTGEQQAGSYSYTMTYNADEVYFKDGEIYEYFQCKDTIDTEVGQGIRVTRYESEYDFSIIIQAINDTTERGFKVDKVMVGKKAYPAYMVRFSFAGADGNMYTECDYQVSYNGNSLLITAIYDVEHSDVISDIIATLELK